MTTRSNTRLLDNEVGNTGERDVDFGGGGLWLEDSTLAMTRSTVSGNKALANAFGLTQSVGGGGLYIDPAANSSITFTTVSDNVSGGEGGGVYLKNGTLTLDRVMIELNAALANDATGGGLFLDAGSATTENRVTVRNNTGGDRNR